jgi:pyruvoyl-dependent arginine decarboxylase (PvlArgDC)
LISFSDIPEVVSAQIEAALVQAAINESDEVWLSSIFPSGAGHPVRE